MSKRHSEAAFEAAIEAYLTGSGGYVAGDPEAFDAERCLDPAAFLAFVQETQPDEWAYLQDLQKDKAARTLIDDLCRALDSEHQGCLAVLRHGFKCFGKLFRAAYFAPASGMNPETTRRYAANRLAVTRQLRYSTRHGNSLDVVLSLNGIPIITVELKNPMTGQTFRHAIGQYKRDRDPADLLFQFKKRALVHFAVDPDEVAMTTRLAGRNTHFLPFNTDSVVVVTDRVVLDQQLQNTIYQFEHRQGVVQKIDRDSAQLADALAAGVPIVITTLQKFPFVTEKIGDLPAHKYAVVIDEAHSSQGGGSATELKGVLGGAAIRDEARHKAEAQGLTDHEEEILRAMAKRGRQPNISFFAFTATPKYKTLEVFGEADGELPAGEAGDGPRPFHLYSMRQAIEEGFILDVLASYTTYKTYYRLIKSVEDDPEVDKRKAARALARFMSLHPHNIAQKTEVMVEHFRQFTMHRIGGKAKAMVVTSSRLHAVRYKQAFDRYISEKGYQGIQTLVAFSGTVADPDAPGVEYTEVGMNAGLREKELPERFGSEEYQVLLVAEKYQTGFDQPLLHTMYVDKRLAGIQAVQTLSRLNRTCSGKEDTFVLDFVNDPEEILAAFQPYYEQTLVGERAEASQLYEIQAKLDGQQVYHRAEVEEFCKVFYRPRQAQTPADHARMNACIDPAVRRCAELADGPGGALHRSHGAKRGDHRPLHERQGFPGSRRQTSARESLRASSR